MSRVRTPARRRGGARALQLRCGTHDGEEPSRGGGGKPTAARKVPSPCSAPGLRSPTRVRREPGEARLLASGALLQQVAQASGLLVLLAIVTVLARRLSVAELGAYGLVASLAGYLLVLRNSVAASAVRAMAAAVETGERRGMFSAAAALYAAVGIATGAADRRGRPGDRGADPRGRAGQRRPRRRGRPGPGHGGGYRGHRLARRAARRAPVRARRRAPRSSAVALYLAVMLALIFAGAELGVLIAASGAMPLFSGTLCGARGRRARPGFALHAVRRHARAG